MVDLSILASMTPIAHLFGLPKRALSFTKASPAEYAPLRARREAKSTSSAGGVERVTQARSTGPHPSHAVNRESDKMKDPVRPHAFGHLQPDVEGRPSAHTVAAALMGVPPARRAKAPRIVVDEELVPTRNGRPQLAVSSGEVVAAFAKATGDRNPPATVNSGPEQRVPTRAATAAEIQTMLGKMPASLIPPAGRKLRVGD